MVPGYRQEALLRRTSKLVADTVEVTGNRLGQVFAIGSFVAGLTLAGGRPEVLFAWAALSLVGDLGIRWSRLGKAVYVRNVSTSLRQPFREFYVGFSASSSAAV